MDRVFRKVDEPQIIQNMSNTIRNQVSLTMTTSLQLRNSYSNFAVSN